MNDSNLNLLILICLVGHLSEITAVWKSLQLSHGCVKTALDTSDIQSAKICGIEEKSVFAQSRFMNGERLLWSNECSPLIETLIA